MLELPTNKAFLCEICEGIGLMNFPDFIPSSHALFCDSGLDLPFSANGHLTRSSPRGLWQPVPL
jgi:hypothetical protein